MRIACLLAWLVAAAIAVAPAAAAHAVRIATDPAAEARLSIGPAQVSATFNEPLQSAFAAMTVVGPDGKLWSAGDPRVQGAVLSVDVRPLGPVGRYTVNYRVTSEDGHPISGSWWFELTTPGTGTPAAPGPAAGHSDGIPTWPLLVAGAAAIAVAAVWAVRRSR
jgi:copper resistance protein C